MLTLVTIRLNELLDLNAHLGIQPSRAFAAVTTWSTSTPTKQSGTWPMHRDGGRRT